MSYIVKSSLDISSTIIPWNERENERLIKEKKEYIEKMKKEQEVKSEEVKSEEVKSEEVKTQNNKTEEKTVTEAKAVKRNEAKKNDLTDEKNKKAGEE